MKIVNLIDKAFFLQNCPLFTSLDMEHLLIVSQKLELLYLKNKESVFSINDNSLKMYLIVEGSITIRAANQEIKLESEDFFGEEGLFSEEKRKYGATANRQTILLGLAKSHLFTLIQEYPEVAINLLKTFTKPLLWRARNSDDN